MRRFLLAAVGLPAALSAQPADEAPFGVWYVYNGTATFGPGPFGAHAEVQHRNHALTGDLQQLLLRTSGRYTLADRSATFAVGYGFVRTEAEGRPDRPFDEHRTYGEALLRGRVGRAGVDHRFRYEQRFVEGADVQTRYRYALVLAVPLGRPGAGGRGPFLAGSNEVFLRGAGRGDGPVFDRVRLYGGVGYRLGGRLAVQAGYLRQAFADGADDQVQLAVQHTFAF